jgi:Uma2 family endonuclease
VLRSGSRSHVAADDVLEGAPELIVEVTTDSSSFDLQVKRRVYERQGVREYVVWRTQDGEIDWFVLRQSSYERLEPESNGILKSVMFPGLWIQAKQRREPLMRALLDTLREGLASTKGVRQ